MDEKTHLDPLRDRPCWDCPKNETCREMCDRWEDWFTRAWQELQQLFKVIKRR